MIQIESKRVVESRTVPGVTFTVRRLNRIQRAKRDLPVMASIIRYSELLERYREIQSAKDRPPEQSEEMKFIAYEINLLSDRDFKPAAISAGLISIQGLEIDGKPATAESLLALATDEMDELIAEIHEACEQGSGLTVDQSKNSQSPSTSHVPTDGEISGTTAEPAAQ